MPNHEHTYHMKGQLWTPIPIYRGVKAYSIDEAKVQFIAQVAKDFGMSEDKARQMLYIIDTP